MRRNQEDSERRAFTVVSAFPGRVRLRFERRYVRNGYLRACAERLSRLAGVRNTEIVADAASVIVRYAPSEQSLAAILREIDTAAVASLPTPPQKPPSEDAPIPDSMQSENGALSRGRPAEQTTGTSLAVRHPIQKAASQAKGVDASGQLKITRAQDIPAGKGPGYKPMIVPTVAVALAALEALPVAVVGSVVALAALPIARRVGAGVRSRKITVDELDLANVAWLALQSEFLTASIVAWLISLGELIRGKTVRYARQEISRLAALAEQGEAGPDLGKQDHARRVLEAIRNAPLSDTRIENVSSKAANGLSLPVFAAAVGTFLLTRDPSDFISIMKPRTDFAFGQGFSVPATILNAVTATTPQGPLFTDGSALERLARVDAVVFAEVGTPLGEAQRKSLADALLDRGIRRLLIPNAPPARRGRPRARTETPAERTEAMILRLKEQGYTVAVIGDRVDDSPAFREADVRISLDRDADLTQSRADVVLLKGDITALPIAVDVARETMRIVRQNTTVAAGAAAVNLTTALLRLSPAPLSTIINTGSIALVGMNALRPFYPALPEPAAPQRPAVLVAEGTRA